MCTLAVSGVREARESGLVGGDFEGAQRAAELEAALAAGGAVRSQDDRGARHRGREFECSVLGNEEPLASLPCEILPSREFYDYEDKYLLDQAQVRACRRI